jgi:SAM-dependent methyltransferase
MATASNDWDVKHRASVGTIPDAAGFLRELLPVLPHGPAIDLACGTGRHTLLLAERHQPITAVDRSPIALEILEERGLAKGLAVSHGNSSGPIAPSLTGTTLICADLEASFLQKDSFTLVVCINYLQRTLFRQMARALLPGGMLLMETYTTAQLAFANGPRSLEHLLNPGELRLAFSSLEVLFYRELRAGQGIASLLARKPTVAK